MIATGADTLRAECLAAYRGHVSFATAMLAELNGAGVRRAPRAPMCTTTTTGVIWTAAATACCCSAIAIPVSALRSRPNSSASRSAPGSCSIPQSPRRPRPAARVAPDGLAYVTLLNWGADAVELAFKLSRLAGKDHVVAMHGGFHGKTFGALTLTAHERYRDPFKPLVPGVVHVPFGEMEPLAAVLAQAPGRCCVFMEPIQAEAGVRIPPELGISAYRC